MSEVLCFLSGFFAGVAVACAIFCILLLRLRKCFEELGEVIKSFLKECDECKKVVDELLKSIDKVINLFREYEEEGGDERCE